VCRLARCLQRHRVGCHEHVDAQASELSGDLLQALWVVSREAVLDTNRLALYIPEVE